MIKQQAVKQQEMDAQSPLSLQSQIAKKRVQKEEEKKVSSSKPKAIIPDVKHELNRAASLKSEMIVP